MKIKMKLEVKYNITYECVSQKNNLCLSKSV